ncbi:RNA exonuclease 4-like isoform X2 [Pieris napi]|uniref:RNA exonuclease 4-like isoform X2 n=1 Tax=Pieris napi TaxID=78633 RepID=UPI001FB86AA0|nr:RNA exonuclease 4-like isoform X2 [Pieris napi]
MVRFYAIDCEMVENDLGKSMVARVSLVDEALETVLDEYIKPTRHVADYRTSISGIKRGYETEAKPKDEVVRRLKSIINGHVLVGYDVEKDLEALGISHSKVKDVATYQRYQISGQKQSLKKLAQQELGLSIQNGPHDSVEDAKAVMRIYNKDRF